MAKDAELVDPEALAGLVRRVFQARGMDAADAERVARVLIWADLSGHGSHGVSRVPRYLAFIERGDLDPAARPACDVDRGACFRIDGGRAAGAVSMRLAVEQAAQRAKQNGVALGVIVNTTHIGAAGYYAWELTCRGMVGICGSAGVPLMAYHGAAKPSLATAPLAIGVPTASRPPLLLDMASSVAALGKIRQALANGTPIGADWALDEDGKPTTDPAQAAILRPLGGPKGSGLALMLECLASVLGAAPILAGVLGGSAKKRHRQNAVVIAVNVEAFRPLAEFTRDIDALVAALKEQPRMQGVSEILMPGENSARHRERRLTEGIPVGKSLLEELRSAAA